MILSRPQKFENVIILTPRNAYQNRFGKHEQYVIMRIYYVHDNSKTMSRKLSVYRYIIEIIPTRSQMGTAVISMRSHGLHTYE